MINSSTRTTADQEVPPCPNCRGSGAIISHWRYIGNRGVTGATQIDAPPVRTSPPFSRTSSEEMERDRIVLDHTLQTLEREQQSMSSLSVPNGMPRSLGPQASVPRLQLNRTQSHRSIESARSVGSRTSVFDGIPEPPRGLLTGDGDAEPHAVPVPADDPENDIAYVQFGTSDRQALSYHACTQLRDGTQALLIDPGSVGNLCGATWSRAVAKEAWKNGMSPQLLKRDRPLTVSGVGQGAQVCTYDSVLPVCFEKLDGTPQRGTIRMPTVDRSDLPGLLGLDSLRRTRAILDLNTLKLHFCGPADYRLEEHLPAGTDSFDLQLAPSGHLLLPCSCFSKFPKASGPEEPSLALHAVPTTEDTPHPEAASSSAPARIPTPPPPPPPYTPPGLDAVVHFPPHINTWSTHPDSVALREQYRRHHGGGPSNF